VWAEGRLGPGPRPSRQMAVSSHDFLHITTKLALDVARVPLTHNWRPARPASGNFEGVLGFGGPAVHSSTTATPTTEPTASSSASPATPLTSSFDSPIAHPVPKEPQDLSGAFGIGGGPGWGSGQKKWRLAAAMSGREDRVSDDDGREIHLTLFYSPGRP
jgi:hypothetical protein